MARRQLLSITPGQLFGSLVAQKPLPPCPWGARQWLFLCSCGKEFPALLFRMARGEVTSCGCLLTEAQRQRRTWKPRVCKKGQASSSWKGGRGVTGKYIRLFIPEHPRATKSGYMLEHIIIAEQALGRLLPKGAVVHHSNENRHNNTKSNLVICQNEAYHKLLHQRMRALNACGNASARKCWLCKNWEVDLTKGYARTYDFVHHACKRIADASYRRRVRGYEERTS